MSLRIRFRFDGRCSVHPRYNPEKDGRPEQKDCPGCESLYVIHLYCHIARKKAETGDGVLVAHQQARPSSDGSVAVADEDLHGPPDGAMGEVEADENLTLEENLTSE